MNNHTVEMMQLWSWVWGFFVALVICGMLQVVLYFILKLRKKLPDESSVIRKTLFIALFSVLGAFFGWITGFFVGGVWSDGSAQWMYAPLIGAMYGIVGGFFGGIISAGISLWQFSKGYRRASYTRSE